MENGDIYVGDIPLMESSVRKLIFEGAAITERQATLWKLRGLHKTYSRLCRRQ